MFHICKTFHKQYYLNYIKVFYRILKHDLIHPDTLLGPAGKPFLPCATIQNKTCTDEYSLSVELSGIKYKLTYETRFPGDLAACQSDVTDLCVMQHNINYL